MPNHTHGIDRRTKLSEEQVREILYERHFFKTSAIDIAEKYGVTTQNIQAIMRRQIWKHIDLFPTEKS